MPEIFDVHDILALKMSHASTVIMNDRQKPQNFQNKSYSQQRCVNFVNHLDRIRVLAILCPVKSKVAVLSRQWSVKNQWPSAREWLSRGANGPVLRCNAGQL